MNDEQFKFFFELMPEERQKKVMRYVRAEDRKLCVAAYALLDYALSLKGYKTADYRFCENETGKPYLENLPLRFNISHSSDVVACIVSQTEVGVDVQKKVSEYKNVMRRVYCKNEIDLVLDSKTPVDDFTMLWALKESYVKCIGTGISDMIAEYDFSSVVKENEGRAYGYEFTALDCGEYVLAVCSSQMPKNIKKLSASELYNFRRVKNV